MLSVKCAKGVAFESDAQPAEPVVLFDLNSIGIDATSFLKELRGSFDELEWDYYDVRREQIQTLERLGKGELVNGHFKPFYAGELRLEELLSRISIPQELREQLCNIAPYRRRSTARFLLSRSAPAEWKIELLPNLPISQQVPSNDYRSIPRGFKQTSPDVIANSQFQQLLTSIGSMVEEATRAVSALEVTCWQTGIVAKPERAGSNSPEGVHQDGADFIISALVVDRENIVGGTSRVFGPDKATEHLEVTLAPGQGIFQADAGSSLWHDVTPIQVDDPSEGSGIRNLFGFDINIRGKSR